MPDVLHTIIEHNHDIVCEQNECKQGMNPGKIHVKPANQKSFANQWWRTPTWHGVWRGRETCYLYFKYNEVEKMIVKARFLCTITRLQL